LACQYIKASRPYDDQFVTTSAVRWVATLRDHIACGGARQWGSRSNQADLNCLIKQL